MSRRFPPRGLDFYLKWSIGNWAEEAAYRFCGEVLARELNVRAYRYGYSAGRVPESLAEFEEILEERVRLEEYGKRPNFLLFDAEFARLHERELSQLMRRADEEVGGLVEKAVLGLEVEHSAWSVKRARRALSFTVKEEDVQPLKGWQERFRVPVVVLQAFLDELHARPLEEVVREGRRRRDHSTKKMTYFLPTSAQTRLADIEGVYFDARVEFDGKGKLIPFVTLKGGFFTNVSVENVRKLGAYVRGRSA
jgi:hypothetical protein